MAEDKRGNEFVVRVDRKMSEYIFHSVILLVRKTTGKESIRTQKCV